MKILEYDQVDALGVFQVTMLASGFPLTPEHAAHLRRTDLARSLACRSAPWRTGWSLGRLGFLACPC